MLCLSITGLGVAATQLSSCAPLPIYKGETSDNTLTVPLSSFTDNNRLVVVRNSKMEFDILLVKNDDHSYTAMLMKCTHQDNPLTANKNGLYCASHGSAFDLNGNVTKEPALAPLKKFNTEVNSSSIIINLKS